MKFDCGLSHEQIQRALGLSKGLGTNCLQRTRQVGLTWEMASALAESVIGAPVAGHGVTGIPTRVRPDWPVIQALRHKGVTLQLL